jgi:UDP-glucose 4-epimerase
MKIAITGGAGFIGAHLARAYLDAGHDVVVIDNLLHGCRQSVDRRARFYQVDIRDRKLGGILQQERPDIVSHHAAQQRASIPGEQSLADADVHVRGLLNVLESCINASVRKVIFASGGNSMYGYTDNEQLPVKEDAPLCPRHPYDISKVAGEWYVRYYTHQYRLKHTILRYADIYGEADSECAHHPLTYFIQMLSKGRRPIIRGTGEEIRDQLFIEDAVEANLCALKRGDNQTLHISAGCGCSLNQLCRMVALLLKSELEPVHISGTLVEEHSIVLDNSRAERVLGWRPQVTLAEGIERALEIWDEGREDEVVTEGLMLDKGTGTGMDRFIKV